MTHGSAGLLRPCVNAYRSVMTLDGFWRVNLDVEGVGDSDGWQLGVPGASIAAVPGAINEQLIGAASHVGAIWYERSINVPMRVDGQQVLIRFDAAPLTAVVWLDGEEICRHEGGFLPFACDITDRLRLDGTHRLTVRVEHGLSLQRTPVGGGPGTSIFGGHPATAYDFFPYGGLIRPVRLLVVPATVLTNLFVQPFLSDGSGGIRVSGSVLGEADRVELVVRGTDRRADVAVDGNMFSAELTWPDPRLWSCADPHLDDLEIRVIADGKIRDMYVQSFGVRTIAVDGISVRLNGEPVQLNGFGKHEDFPVFGRGLATPVIVRNGELLKWIGANSYRTSHYPYAEEALEYADRAGILVISETSAVGLNFYDETDNVAPRLAYVRAELDALILRDRNHPCVIAWSVANEPFAKPIFQPGAATAEAVASGVHVLGQLVADARARDTTRPVMVVGAQGHPDDYIELGDIVGINRYYGWYSQSGRIAEGAAQFGAELDALARLGKPVLVSEFGTDTLPGCHAADPEMWTEEYQADFIAAYLDEMATRPHVCGAHVWNFADFKTTQSILRAGGLNHKGVFTRDRRPKLAAHLLRRRWAGKG